MLRTRLCDLLGIEAPPIIQGPLGGPWGQSMDLPAAVCAAGGLGSRHHSISSCSPGNRRWKFFKDFSCQGKR